MALSTIYGVNGVGMDTVGAELVARHPDTLLTSESRLLMFILDITTGIDSRTRASRDQYKQLEETPQSRMIEIQDTDYRYLVDDLSKQNKTTIILSHLVFALYLDKQVTYLDSRDVPEWYVEANDAVVQLTAPAGVILERRMKDAALRDRGTFTVQDIEEHQRLCGRKWEKITSLACDNTVFAVVENVDLIQATQETEHAIYR